MAHNWVWVMVALVVRGAFETNKHMRFENAFINCNLDISSNLRTGCNGVVECTQWNVINKERG